MNFKLNADESVTITEAGQTITLSAADVLAVADTIRTHTREPELGRIYRHTTPAKWASR